MTKNERFAENRELVSKCVECMIYHIKNEVPEKGKFRGQASAMKTRSAIIRVKYG